MRSSTQQSHIKVWPAPADPYPDWDPDKPSTFAEPEAPCRVVLQNSKFIGATLNDEVIARMFANQELCALRQTQELVKLNSLKNPNPTTIKNIVLETEYPLGVGNNVQ
jgi:hypothetical protein